MWIMGHCHVVPRDVMWDHVLSHDVTTLLLPAPTAILTGHERDSLYFVCIIYYI